MARESAISKWLDCGIGTESEFKSRWATGGETREKLWKEIGYANEGAAYNAARNAGILAGGQVSTGGNNGDGEKSTRKARVKGCLPIEVEKWAVLSAQADFIRDGNDEDDFIIPEITPEFFISLRAVKNETKAYAKIIARIGGLNGEAGKALRAWAGKPLTLEQAKQEENTKNNKVTSQIDNQIFNLANYSSKAVRAVIFSLFCDETLLDRKLNGGFLPFC